MTLIFQSVDLAWENDLTKVALTPHAVGATDVPRVGDNVELKGGFRGRVAKVTWIYWQEGLRYVLLELDPLS